MDSASYLRNAERTLSTSFHADTVPHDYFIDLVFRVIALGDELDALKRELYYGALNPHHAVPLDFASSLAGHGTGRGGSSLDAGLGGQGSAGEAGGRDPGFGRDRGSALPADAAAGTDPGTDESRGSGAGAERGAGAQLDGPVGTPRLDPFLLHAVLGILTEGVELFQAIHNEPLDQVHLLEEVGDVEWYLAIVYRYLQRLPEDARERNIAKLRRRFPDRFTEEGALKRDLQVERQALEGSDPDCGCGGSCLCQGEAG